MQILSTHLTLLSFYAHMLGLLRYTVSIHGILTQTPFCAEDQDNRLSC